MWWNHTLCFCWWSFIERKKSCSADAGCEYRRLAISIIRTGIGYRLFTSNINKRTTYYNIALVFYQKERVTSFYYQIYHIDEYFIAWLKIQNPCQSEASVSVSRSCKTSTHLIPSLNIGVPFPLPSTLATISILSSQSSQFKVIFSRTNFSLTALK